MIKNLKFILILLVLTNINCSCRKDVKVFFKSSKYVGKYAVTVTSNASGQSCQQLITYPTTQKIIVVNYGKTDSTINVFGQEILLDSLGNDPWSSLKIHDDTLTYYYSEGPLGCKRNYNYNGVRFDTSPN